MKRAPSNEDFYPVELAHESKKILTTLSRAASLTKTYKVIPIKDAYLAKLLIKKQDKLLAHFSEFAESLSVKYRLKSDLYSTALELSVESPENYGNIETLSEQFGNILSEISMNLNEFKIHCSPEEHTSLMKQIEKGRILTESDIHYESEFNSKPLLLKGFIVNEGFSIEIVLVEDLQHMKFEPSDNLVTNVTNNGIFLDEIMQKQKISNNIAKFFKKNRNFYIKNEIFEANLPEFKVFLQVRDTTEILEPTMMFISNKNYIRQILDKIIFNKQYVNLYYPISIGREKEVIKLFLQELLDLSTSLSEDSNFLMFPSKISFLCIEKQKELVLDLFEKFKSLGSLEELPNDLKHAGRWSVNNNDFQNVGLGGGGLFGNPMPLHNMGKKLGSLDVRVSKTIEKAFILGEKNGFVLIDEKKLQKTIGQNINQGSLLQNRKNFKKNPYNQNYKNNSHNDNSNQNFVNEDEITIDLKRMSEVSKLTNYEKPIIYDESQNVFQFLDEITGTFQNYSPEITKILTFLKKIHSKKLVYHHDFDTMAPVEQLYSFDLNNFTLKSEKNVALQNKNLNNVNNLNAPVIKGNSFAPMNQFAPLPMMNQFAPLPMNQVINIARTKDEKLNNFHKRNLKYIKNKGNPINIREVSTLEIEIPTNKTPQLMIRSIENTEKEKIIKAIKELFQKKEVEFFMKMNQNSRMLQKSLEDLCTRNNVHWDLKDKTLRIVGNRKTITRILSEVRKLDEMDLEDALLPETWELQTENLKEIELSFQSLEFSNVSTAFKTTCPQNEIVKITRIQNKKLWENYVFEKKRLQFKGNCTEKMLFHGTRANDPRKIYSGIEEGFDVRLANHGAVGKGIYFAEAASYSVSGFAYSKGSNNFLLIYANVLVGASFSSMGGNFIMPPLMPNDSNMRFDSVKIGTNYTVYNSNRAYPAYIIEYKMGNNQNMMGRGLFNLSNNPIINNNYHNNEDEDDDEEEELDRSYDDEDEDGEF